MYSFMKMEKCIEFELSDIFQVNLVNQTLGTTPSCLWSVVPLSEESCKYFEPDCYTCFPCSIVYWFELCQKSRFV